MDVNEMSIDAIDDVQRKAAKIAGFALLFAVMIVIFANYGVSFRLIVPGDAAETARNILANELLFRINVACDLLYVADILVLMAALYVILKPVNQGLALTAVFCRLVYALMWVVTALNMLDALALLGQDNYLRVFEVNKLQTLARLHLRGSWDAYYVGLPFWGLASMLCSYLWFKSGYIPRALAGFGLIASAWCVLCAFTFIIYPNFKDTVDASWFDTPLVLFEIVTGFWLLIRGLKPSGVAAGTR
jgi:hypothetical protein